MGNFKVPPASQDDVLRTSELGSKADQDANRLGYENSNMLLHWFVFT